MQIPEVAPSKTEPRPKITIKPKKGRITTWAIKCTDEEHGDFPGAPKSKRVAIDVAMKHKMIEHRGDANIAVIGKA